MFRDSVREFAEGEIRNASKHGRARNLDPA
jgi:hypothetical protein